MGRVGEIIECECGCGRFFRRQKPDQRFKDKTCARTYEAAQRRPSTDERVAAILRAIEVEIRKHLR